MFIYYLFERYFFPFRVLAVDSPTSTIILPGALYPSQQRVSAILHLFISTINGVKDPSIYLQVA